MPSTATITAFYSFTANTKARATQVNANFDIFRGHIIPVSPNTTTAINNTYDLGSYEYKWANGYINNLELGTTSTKSAIISIDSNTTASEMIFKINGTEKFRVNNNGFYGNNGRPFGVTTSASYGNMAASLGLTTGTYFEYTTGSTAITAMTVTIETIGRPVFFYAAPINFNSSTPASIIVSASAAGDSLFGATVRLKKSGGGSEQSVTLWHNHNATTTAGTIVRYFTPKDISFIDTPSSGTHTYYLEYSGFVAGRLYFENIRLTAIEL